jgi:FkbM family methyltransferase
MIGRGRRIAKLIYPLYLSKDKTVVSKIEDVPYIFLEDDFALFFYLHDRDLYQVISQHIKNGDFVLDIGAHQGFFSALLANFVGKEGKVFSIEAMPETFDILKRNAKVAGKNGYKIFPYQYAVSDSEGVLDFYAQERSPVNSLFDRWPSDPNLNIPREKIQIQSITIDDFILLNAGFLNKVDFVKIDVEGAEWSVLQGSKNLLTQMPPRLIAIETSSLGLSFYKKTPNDLINFMKEFDYEPRNLSLNNVNIKDFDNQGNYYFFHKSYLNSL